MFWLIDCDILYVHTARVVKRKESSDCFYADPIFMKCECLIEKKHIDKT